MATVADLSGNFPANLPNGIDVPYSYYLGEIENPEKRSIVYIGQSNAVGIVRDAAGVIKSVMDEYYPDSTNLAISCATGGAALLAANGDGTNHYYDPDTGVDGAAWINAVNVLRAHLAAGYYPIAVVVDQGESDQDNIDTTAAEYQAAFELLFIARVRTLIGRQVPIFIIPIGRYDDGVTTWSTWQTFRELQRTIVAENDGVHMLPEKFATPMDGGYHQTIPGYQTNAYRTTHSLIAVASGLYPESLDPQISSAARAGTEVVVNLDHTLGDDFTPTTAIEGFAYYDDGVEVAISAAVRGLTGSDIVLTLGGTPAGTEVLYYGYAEMTGVDYTNLVLDNSVQQLPLRSATVTPDIAGAASIERYVPSTVLDIDARIAASYGGSGQTVANIAATPADASTAAANDFQLGTTSASTTTDPTFTGSAGTAGAYFALDGGDVFTLAGSLTTFLGDLHKDTGSSWWVAINWRFVAGATTVLFSTGSSSTLPHLRIQMMTSSNVVRVQFRDDASNVTTVQSNTALTTNTDYRLVCSYDRDTGEVRIYINSDLPDIVETITQGATAATLTGTIAFCGASNGGAALPSGSRFYGGAVGNDVITDREVAAIMAVYADRAV